MGETYIVTIDGQDYEVQSTKPLTDQQAYDAALQQFGMGETFASGLPVKEPTPAEPQAKVPYSPTKELLRSTATGPLLGFADELEAAVRTGAISGPEYETLRNRLRAQQEQFGKDYPLASLGSQISGSALLPIGAMTLGKNVPSVLTATGGGAVLGGVQGAGYSTDPDRLASDIAGGALMGGAGGGAIGTLGALTAPKVQPGARLLQKEGVPLTPGEAFGGGLQTAEQRVQSIPLIGDLVGGARRSSLESFNKAVFNRALNKLDEKIKVPQNISTKEAADFTYGILSRKYDEIYQQVSVTLNKRFTQQLDAIKNKYSKGKIGESNYNQLSNRIDEIKARFGEGPITGQRIKALKQELSADASNYQKLSGDQNLLAEPFMDLENSFMKSVRVQNPKFASQLKKVDEAYANYKIGEAAASSARGAEGVFTPAQLEMAVKRSDTSVGKNRFARGKATMQDLSSAGYDVLGTKVPDSGTAGRGIMALLLGGGAASINPKFGLPAVGGSLLYTKPGMKYATPLLYKERPAVVQKVGEAVRRGAPFSSPLINQFVPGGLLRPEENQ